jgi:RNA polymerase sigma-70 factor (ECF subfamily)
VARNNGAQGVAVAESETTVSEAEIQQAFAEGQRRWPEALVSIGDFSGHLHRLQVSTSDLRARGPDIYLACACAAGHPGALSTFEREYLGQVKAHVARLGLRPDLLDELRQRLRVRLLAGRPARINSYAGVGPLWAWVRVASIRIAVDLASGEASAPEDDRQLASNALPAVVPEDQVARAVYGPLIQRALEAAIAELSPTDKSVLRFHFLEQLTLDAVATIYRVHRATVARWLVAIKRRLLRSVRTQLSIDLGTSPSEFKSLLEVVMSDLQLSFARWLQR